jgi:ubiquinone/menaquinone biosynthesis C-methylase UbiE
MIKPLNIILRRFNEGVDQYELHTGGSTRDIARHILELCPSFDSDSIVLDNACGNGIVAQELLSKVQSVSAKPPIIHCVDGAPAMVEAALDILQLNTYAPSMKFGVMPGEDLKFPDDYFTHSITNMGIVFFEDPVKGATEIYRTLKPGGMAIVTSWAHLSYLDSIHQAQKDMYAESPLFKIGIKPEWYTAAHLGDVMRKGGFDDVTVHERDAYFAAATPTEVCDILMPILAGLVQSWTEGMKQEFRQYLETAIRTDAKRFRRPGSDFLYGLPMKAHVAVATK